MAAITMVRCLWPGCPVTAEDGALVVWEDQHGRESYCLEHVTDDFLPPVSPGVVGSCVGCGKTSVTWLVGPTGPGDPEDTALHERCRRNWAMGRVRPEESGAKGAWARRRAASAG